ncbi:MAG TPA: 5-(carboxyamino)imidazole ribonucleotide mutase [bacterium]|uniref:N5-carboxyaminoimidazole ribonucleotide mutase n=1 Tax=candidate division TA06 bacterium ADurb.Bin417 TaxID=1852828 RepID=A0A1V5MJ58_UNCT6|nr:MAG: N5-carboxyaminoimidazole ribonucleotide mutase [candidate division TA06 bacterium ADurb.Bin417]HNQ35041.1 5-(carboxyamino)imidazole ribonucleotide mutase [bacterium]HNS48196.1 5-(carboxyamino)imidazole ribonucleotide mutase [bacterium]
MAEVVIVVGSKSDLPALAPAEETLKASGIDYEVKVLSAHRQPDETAAFAQQAAGRGVRVIIAAAGLSAALPGFIASHTTLPVLGVPLAVGPLNGLDALLAILQMPRGIPVATLGLGSQGPQNAALLAARILALAAPGVATRSGRKVRR